MKFIATLVSVCFFMFALLILLIAKTVSGTVYLVTATVRLFNRQHKPVPATGAVLTGTEVPA